MSTPKLKLSYYPMAGRSLAIRAALTAAGVEFEFEGLTDWSEAATNEDRKRFPLGDIPVLEVKKDDGSSHVICETIPICHYVGNVTGYWPKDALTSTQTLEAFTTFELIISGAPWDKDDANYNMTYAMDEEVAKKAKAGPITRRMKFYLTRINDIVAQWGKNDLNIFDVSLTANIFAAQTGSYYQGVDFSYLPELTNITTRMDMVKTDPKLMAAIMQIAGPK